MASLHADDLSLYKSETGYREVMEAYEASLARSPVPLRSDFVPTAFGRTHVLRGGPPEAKPVILLHGWNGNASTLAWEFPFLFTRFAVWMPDILGHPGKSAPSRLPTQGGAYAAWLTEIADRLGVGSAHVVGISGGGWLGLKWAAHAPERVRKLVAVSTDGLVGLNPAIVFSRGMWVGLIPTRRTVRWFVDLVSSHDVEKGEDHEAFLSFLLPTLKHFRTQRNPGLLLEQELRDVTAPTLVLLGEQERLFDPRRAAARARSLIPGLVSLELVPHAGHLLTLDRPETLRTKILEFLTPD
jgi:pimeloyl-ACP methyl ester carboxylesterase